MRTVIDTNVLISAVIRPQGRVGPILLHLRQGTFTLLYSTALLEELVNVLDRPRFREKYGVTDTDIEALARLILVRGELVAVKEPIEISRDPKDNKFLETAVAGRADLLVSGDEDLLVLHPFRDIDIVSPAVFLDQLDKL